MTYPYSFIQGSLEWPFTEFFLSDTSLENQYEFIGIKILLCNFLINHQGAEISVIWLVERSAIRLLILHVIREK